MDIQFTDREIDVMEVLWERGPSLVSEVRAALNLQVEPFPRTALEAQQHTLVTVGRAVG